MNDSDSSKPQRRRYQFSLRTLLVFVAVVSVVLACTVPYLRWWLDTAPIRRIGGEVLYVHSPEEGQRTLRVVLDGQTFTDDILIAMMEVLDEADVPKIGRSLVGDPSTMADIYKIDKFVRLDFQNTQVVATGNIGQLYGIPVFISNNLTAASTGNYGVLIHTDAIGLVIQDGPTVEAWREHKRHSDIINVSAMWGEDEVRDAFGIPFYTRKS